MKTIHCFLLIAPLLLAGAEHEVPMGTKGNKLVFNVSNPSPVVLRNLHIAIQAGPDWAVFENKTVEMDSISPKGRKDAEFRFQVLNGEVGRNGAVELTVSDERGGIRARRIVQMKTVLETNETKLFAPYPNPSNSSTVVQYAMPEARHVKMEVYNVLGRSIRMLINEEKPAGQWNIVWDGKDDDGGTVTSGVYMVRFQTAVKGRMSHVTSKIMIQR
jgi:hypothetical protein